GGGSGIDHGDDAVVAPDGTLVVGATTETPPPHVFQRAADRVYRVASPTRRSRPLRGKSSSSRLVVPSHRLREPRPAPVDSTPPSCESCLRKLRGLGWCVSR